MLKKLSLKDKTWRGMALSIAKDKDLADDLVQCMYLRILDYNIPSSKATDTFVYVVMLNLFKESKRKAKYNDTFCHSFNESITDVKDDAIGSLNYFYKLTDTQPQSEHDDSDLLIIECINSLPVDDIELLRLNYNYSIRKVAEIRGITYITVYRNLVRIRKKVLGNRFENEYKNRRLKYKNNGRSKTA